MSFRSAFVAAFASLASSVNAWADATVWYDDRFVGGSSSYIDGPIGYFPSVSYSEYTGQNLVVNDGTYGFAAESPLSGGHATWDSRYSPSGLGPAGEFTSLRTFGELTARAIGPANGLSQTFFAARTMIAITVTEVSTWAFDGSVILEAFGPSIPFNLTQARFDFAIYEYATGGGLNNSTTVLAGQSAVSQPLSLGGVFAPGDYLISWDLFASADSYGDDLGARAALDGTFSVTPVLIPLPGGLAMGAAGLGAVGLAAWRRRSTSAWPAR